MKKFFFFVLFFILCINITEVRSQTYANLAGPENVLIVFNSQDPISEAVKNYYVNARGIPDPLNVVDLAPLPFNTTITYQGVPHNIVVVQYGDRISDISNPTANPTFHAWKYFLDYIATPIKQHLQNYDLEETIRYIVLCKGIPFEVNACYNSAGNGVSANGNLPVDGLLCLLNTPNYESFIENTVYPVGKLTNPYYLIDPDYTMDYRFLPDLFTNANYKLSYLVSHIDGIDYQTVKNIIDRSVASDKSGEGVWILDDDLFAPGVPEAHRKFTYARQKLASFGFNVVHDSSNTWITHNTYQGGPVMGYSSWGTHSEDGNCNFNDSAYVADSLQFQYANGAVFSTIESFNGTSLTSLWWRYVAPGQNCSHTQGLMTQYPVVGGTGGVAHAWEPALENIESFEKYYTSYALGYSVVDAAYLSMPKLAWEYVLVGDPLTTIAWGKQTLTQNTTWSGTNLVTGKIIVPAGKTLIFTGSAVINFKHLGSLEISGTLSMQPGAVINLGSGNSFVFNGSTMISGGVILNIGEGTTLTFNNSASLNVYGTLNAIGIESNPITFDFVSPNSTNQNGIKFNSGSSGTINYCQIRNAYRGIYENNVVPPINITNSAISGCTDGIYLYGSDPVIQSCNIHNNSGYGISTFWSSANIQTGNYIQYNNAGGIFCSSSSQPVFGNNSYTYRKLYQQQ